MHETAIWLSLLAGQAILLAILIAVLVLVHRQTKALRSIQQQQRLFDATYEKEEN